MDLTERRELNKGFGGGLEAAFDLALTPIIFAGLGLLLDKWLGIVPVLTIAFFFCALGLKTWLVWMNYEAQMQQHEREGRWVRRS